MAMNAMPKPRHDAAAAPASPLGLADESANAPAAPPPHLLWESLESAFAPVEDIVAEPEEERLPLYIAMPMALGLSLVLWLVIVELVTML